MAGIVRGKLCQAEELRALYGRPGLVENGWTLERLTLGIDVKAFRVFDNEAVK